MWKCGNFCKKLSIIVSSLRVEEGKDNEHKYGGGRVIVIFAGNGHGDTSSNPGRDWLHFT